MWHCESKLGFCTMQVKEKKKTAQFFCLLQMHCHVWSTLKFCFSVSFNFVVSFSIKILSFRCFPYSDRLRAPHMYGGNWWCLAFPSFMPLVLMSSFFYHYYYCSSFLISWAPSATGAPIPGMHERSLFLILNHLRTVTTRVISLSLSVPCRVDLIIFTNVPIP